MIKANRGTGRRKEAVAKVMLFPGTGKIKVNGKDYSVYFCNRKLSEYKVNRPFVVTNTVGKFDAVVKAFGGGVSSQAGAVSLGIARALVELNPELKTLLKREKLMTRDSRMKERKKYGLKRARKAFQYTKR
ncbi:MAG: 30S ribosomal protein S9 [Candidatus Margulisiibacteriota bacterium]